MEEKFYEMVNHPSHYQAYEEVVEMIYKVAGPFIASMWCKWNGFKYRMRMGMKPDNPVQQELEKEFVYLNLYNKYKLDWTITTPDFDKLTEDEKQYISHIVIENGNKINEYMNSSVKEDVKKSAIKNYGEYRELLKD